MRAINEEIEGRRLTHLAGISRPTVWVPARAVALRWEAQRLRATFGGDTPLGLRLEAAAADYEAAHAVEMADAKGESA